MQRCIRHALTICLLAAAIAGCGSKGPLVLPDKTATPASQLATPRPADSPAPSPPAIPEGSPQGSL